MKRRDTFFFFLLSLLLVPFVLPQAHAGLSQGIIAIRTAFGGNVDARDAATGEVLTRQADGSWAGGSAGGGTDLAGTQTDNRLTRGDGTDTVQDSGVTLDDSDNLTGAGGSLEGFARSVEANTAGSGAPHTLDTTADVGRLFSNTGATAENHVDLPTAAAGLLYTFVVTDTDGIQVNVASGDTIQVGDLTATTGTGSIESATVGDTITLVAEDATTWYAVSGVGTWTVN